MQAVSLVFRGHFGLEASKSPAFLVLSLWSCWNAEDLFSRSIQPPSWFPGWTRKPVDACWSRWQRWVRKTSHNNLRKARWEYMGIHRWLEIPYVHLWSMHKWCAHGFMDCMWRLSTSGFRDSSLDWSTRSLAGMEWFVNLGSCPNHVVTGVISHELRK